ncbi:hypothetical protein [Jiella pacifica]|uniref:Uncharacterized protein n=1 Tax=Jiella pacifica TaxID=2696469 RepID=A0A6N9T1H2_9HYPH|nr:hypothetical protein [Jiella pacifica]NDW04035.1 hypothetical protein [Jiella pacifica]
MTSPFTKLRRIVAEIREGDPILRSRLGRARIVEATLDQSPLPQPAAAEGTSMSETSDFIAQCEAFARKFPAATLSEGDPTGAVEGAFSTDRHARQTAGIRMKLAARQRIDEILADDLAATTAAKARVAEEEENARNRELLQRITASIMGCTEDDDAEPAGNAASVEAAPAEASAVVQRAQRVARLIEMIEAEFGPFSGATNADTSRVLIDTAVQVFGPSHLRSILGL